MYTETGLNACKSIYCPVPLATENLLENTDGIPPRRGGSLLPSLFMLTCALLMTSSHSKAILHAISGELAQVETLKLKLSLLLQSITPDGARWLCPVCCVFVRAAARALVPVECAAIVWACRENALAHPTWECPMGHQCPHDRVSPLGVLKCEHPIITDGLARMPKAQLTRSYSVPATADGLRPNRSSSGLVLSAPRLKESRWGCGGRQVCKPFRRIQIRISCRHI